MKLSDYIQYDGVGLAELIRKGEVNTSEIVNCANEAADLLNPDINALIEVFDQALSASDSEAAVFRGVPFIIKDLALHAENVLNEMGSRLTRGLRTPHDTELMKRFRDAGLRTIARASTPEFGYCPTTEPVVNGPSRNPWNLDHNPGGSSGATAASVAAGIVPLAHANDGGGSIRIPASCCGLLGLKPSRGRVPCGPDTAEPLSGLAVEFAVTRSVRDSAHLLDAVNGSGVGDPYTISRAEQSYAVSSEKEPGRKKIAYMTTPWSGSDTDEEVIQACLNTATLCEELGHEVSEAKPDIDWEEFFYATHILWTANIVLFVNHAAAATGRKIDENTLEATTLACYNYGKELKAEQLLLAQASANKISRIVGSFFEEYDLLLSPTTTQSPLLLGEMNANDNTLDAMAWSTKVFDYCPFTPLFNMTGQPAISIPGQLSDKGLPLGVQFAGRFGDETTLLQMARQFERSKPWQQIAPLIHSKF